MNRNLDPELAASLEATARTLDAVQKHLDAAAAALRLAYMVRPVNEETDQRTGPAVDLVLVTCGGVLARLARAHHLAALRVSGSQDADGNAHREEDARERAAGRDY